MKNQRRYERLASTSQLSLWYAHTSNPSQKIKVGRRCTPRGDPTNQLPCALRVYSPVDSHTCQTPWSVFQDGSNGEPTGQRPERADAEACRRCALPATIEETAFHERIKSPGTTGLSPSPAPPSRGLGPGPPLRTLLQTTIRTTEPPDSKAGLFPVRSPLLRESLFTYENVVTILLSLNDKVHWTSRDVAGSEPPTLTRSEHFTGSFNR
ncbi:hypothetical protein CQW23_33161 [Capsicum baccatum]|uniref:Uncharacterized protein n=1 Tax=Capsicum baccatum TaxID=33114 RepID=A0A2G2V2M7_CAPBA|nr:hypothetical protein CQW23_33161 [Capsicum baccatum]